MKRIFYLLLACLLLCGCSVPESQPTTPPSTLEAVAATEPAGSYLPGSQLEVSSSGAVRAYPQDFEYVWDIETAGEDILVFSGYDTTTITRLTGENLFRVAEVQLDIFLSADALGLYISEEWLIYYDHTTNMLVYLDEDLQEFSRLQLPDDLQGAPVLSSDRKQLYYCTTEGLRVMDLESGISRLLKEMSFGVQSVRDLHMGDQFLQVWVSDEMGNGEMLFLDTETGALAGAMYSGMGMTSGDDWFYAINREGLVDRMFFGNGEKILQLTPSDYLDSGVFLPECHAAVVYALDELGLTLEYYDLESGLRTAALALGNISPFSLTADPSGHLYFLADTEDGPVIYRWELSGTPTADETVYTGPWYTLDTPDELGLSACYIRATELSEAYGLEICIGKDATRVMPWDYYLETEYQVPVIEDALDQLEQMLQVFPEGMWETAMAGFEEGALTLCLVRELTGSYESGSLESTDGIQFWMDNHAYVALAMGDRIESLFYHEVFHVLESRILSETIHYYRWDELNPKGFDYDYDYIANQNREGSQYLQDETRSFIDTYSMSYPKEDRARIFEYACMDGNADYFQSKTMQKKLRTLCVGLREAYGLEKADVVFLWEQYLETPLTP